MRMFTNFLRSSKISASGTKVMGLVIPVVMLLVSFQVSNAQLSVNITVYTTISCNGGFGALQANHNGNNPPYTYHWSSGASTQIASNLTSGTYAVTVTDGSLNTGTASAVLNEPSDIVIDFIVLDPITCFGGYDGAIQVVVSGGTPPYTYLWGDAAHTTVDHISNLSYGSYGISIWDNNICIAQSSYYLNQPPQIKIFQLGSIQHVLCYGASTGQVNITYQGGVTPFTYEWSPSGQTTQYLTNAPAGVHTVSLHDANGCLGTKSFTINQPAEINPYVTVTNVNCSGDQNGTASVSVTGGVTPYSYHWYPGGATTSSITGLGTGTYSVTVTDYNLCSKTASGTIAATSLLSFSLTSHDVTCNGLTDGYIELDITSGNIPYIFNWSNSTHNQNATGLAAGTYTVTIYDGNYCPFVSDPVQINEPGGINPSINAGSILCYGGTTTLIVSATGGVTPYTTGVGTYTVYAGQHDYTITDSEGCTETISETVIEPGELLLNMLGTPVTCHGYNNGTATADVSGGTGLYLYFWSETSTTVGITGLTQGTYTVTVSDINSCQITGAYIVTEPDAELVASSVAGTILCYGGQTTVEVSAVGGTSPYTNTGIYTVYAGQYSYTVYDENGCPSVTSGTINQPYIFAAYAHVEYGTYIYCNGGSVNVVIDVDGGVSPYSGTGPFAVTAGTYSYVVTDGNGCTAADDVTVTEPDVLQAISSGVPVLCHGGTGEITVSATGGTQPYGGIGLFTVTAGSYYYTVTDYNGCTAETNITISEPDYDLVASSVAGTFLCYGGTTTVEVSAIGGTPPYDGDIGTFTVTDGTYSYTVTDANGCSDITDITVYQPTEITLDAQVQNVECFGDLYGSIDLYVTGGVGTYDILWSNGMTTDYIYDLGIGTYTVVVTDENGCTASGSYTVSQPQYPLVADIYGSDLLCNGDYSGEAYVNVYGGAYPYSYLWFPGDATTDMITGLESNLYSVVVTDNNGCSVTSYVYIDEPQLLEMELVTTMVECYGGNGAITVSVWGGTTSYEFTWSDGSITQNLNPPAGTYDVTVTDDNNCVITESATIDQPAPLTLGYDYQDVDCNSNMNGFIDVTTDGGITPYTFYWTGPAGYTADTDDIYGLNGGFYELTVTDLNECTNTISQEITEPVDPLTIFVSGVDLLCNDDNSGLIYMSVVGGTTPYIILWSNGATTEYQTGISAGYYSVEVTDSHNCTATAEVIINEPGSIIVQTSLINDATCFGFNDGSVTAIVTGGVTPVNYLWSNGMTTQTISGLIAGTYFVTVTDANYCSGNDQTSNVYLGWTYSITAADHQILIPNSVILANGLPIAVGDFIGVFYNNGSGLSCGGYKMYTGGPTVVVAWGDDNTTPVKDGFDPDLGGELFQWKVYKPWIGEFDATVTYDPGFSNMGNFAVGGNSGLLSFNNPGATYPTSTTFVIVNEPDELIVTLNSKDDVDCYGNSTGSIITNVEGGTLPYDFIWSNGETTQNITGLPFGVYSLTVTDENNCIENFSETIYAPSGQLQISGYVLHNVNCYGGSDGWIELSLYGGSTPYSFIWSNGATTQNATGLVIGAYSVTVTDYNGCSVSQEFFGLEEISQPDYPLSITNSITDVSCNGFSDGAITINVTGGTIPYTRIWSNGETTDNQYDLPAGSYSVTATDANGCIIGASMTVDQPDQLILTHSTSDYHGFSVNCFGSTDGELTINPWGGTSPFAYIWNNGQTEQTITNLSAGTYSVTVTDNNECEAFTSVTLIEPSAILISATQIDILCYEGNNGSINIAPYGGTNVFSYFWTGPGSFTASTQNISDLYVGTYVVIVTDNNGCTATGTYTLTQPEDLVLTSFELSEFSGYNLSCFEGNNGTISMVIDGGVLPYTYSWSNDATDEDVTGLTAGNYIVTITDANGCTITATWDLTQPTELIAQATITSDYNGQDISCFNAQDGSACVTGQGGVSPYTFLWSNSQTSSCISGLDAIIYNVTITDSNTCMVYSGIGGPTPWNYTVTDDNAVILLQSNTIILYGNPAQEISYGDYIGVFFDNNGNLECGGYMLWDGSNNSVTAWSDDPLTPGVKEGFALGEEYIWKTWKPFYGEFYASATYVPIIPANPPFNSTSHFTTDGVSGLLTLVSGGSLNITHTVIGLNQPDELAVLLDGSDVNCNGGVEGSVILDVSGGTLPYTFNWTGPAGFTANTQNISGLSTGLYEVQVNDINGCSVTGSIYLNEPYPLSYSIPFIEDALCYDEPSGRIEIIPFGGTYPYYFDWGGIDPDNLYAGDYIVTITDAGNCSIEVPFTIWEPQAPLTLSSGVTNASCNGYSDGSVAIFIIGGTPGYSILWSDGSTSQNLYDLAAGSYSVTVTDMNGCFEIENIIISQPNPISIIWSESSAVYNGFGVSCNGSSDGFINITAVNGGTSPYTYQWSNSETNAYLTGLAADIYYVEITDSHMCTGSASFLLTEPPVIIASANATSLYYVPGGVYNTHCNANDGSISLTISGGTGNPYSIQWPYTSQTTQDITGLSSANYAATVTDSNGCIGISNTVNLTTPGPVEVTLSTDNFNGFGILCNGGTDPDNFPGTGSLYLTWSGGASPFDIYYNNYVFDLNVPGYSYEHEGFTAGTYWAVVRDNNNCARLSNIVNLTQPDPIEFPAGAVQGISCNGESDGIIDITNMSGGASPYLFQWDSNANWDTTSYLSGLAGGSSYYVIVWDANNCSVGAIFTVPELAPLNISPGSVVNVSCYGGNNGEIIPVVTGGTEPYLFTQINNLSAGTYSVTVTDAHNCTAVLSGVIVAEPVAPLTAVAVQVAPVSCYDGTTTVTIDGSGGTAPYGGQIGTYTVGAGTYSYIISDVNQCTASISITVTQPDQLVASASAASILCNGGNTTVTVDATGGVAPYGADYGQYIVTAGTYDYIVTDYNGCSDITSITVSEPTELVAYATTGNILCFDSTTTVTISGSGGTSPYHGTDYTTPHEVGEGTYTYIIYDYNNCSASVTITITEPTQLEAVVSTTDATCYGYNDGTASLDISGGTPPYNENWYGEDNNALAEGNYMFMVSDNNGCWTEQQFVISQPTPLSISHTWIDVSCNGLSDGSANLDISGSNPPYDIKWPDGSSTPDVSGLAAGTYVVTVMDVNTCTELYSVVISQPDVLTFNFTNTNVSCYEGNDGTAIITNIDGGTPDYSILWSTGETTMSIGSLSAGLYSLIITDNNQCSASAEFTVTQPLPLTFDAILTSPECYGESNGSISLDVTGGTYPHYYQWNNGAQTNPLSGIQAGTYSVIITDIMNCLITGSFELTQPDPLIIAQWDTTKSTCGLSDGAIFIQSITGGTSPYIINWEHTISNNPIQLGLAPGNYTATVVDAHNCTYVQVFTIEDFNYLAFSFVIDNVNCYGESSGSSIDVTVTGGFDPYAYLWSNGETNANISNIVSGTYTVSVTDVNGCTGEASADVLQANSPLISDISVISNTLCYESSEGAIEYTVSGGVAPYNYLWSNGANTEDVNNLPAGNYSVTVTDSYGCQNINTAVITQPDQISASFYSPTYNGYNISCFGGSNGAIDMTPSGGTSPYTYLWSFNSSTSQDLTDVTNGNSYNKTFYVTITDNNGCAKVESTVLSQPGTTVIKSYKGNITTCFGATTGRINISTGPSEGTPTPPPPPTPYTIVWVHSNDTMSVVNNYYPVLPLLQPNAATPMTAEDITGLTGQTLYNLYVIDANGCSTPATYTLTQPSQIQVTMSVPSALIHNGYGVSCFGSSDGTVSVSATGGTGTLDYLWNDEGGSTGTTVNYLNANTYNVTVTDDNNCSSTGTVTVTQPAQFAVSTSQTDVVCNGANTGAVDLIPEGGVTPYSYTWIGPGGFTADTEDIIDVAAGAYSVTVDDANLCGPLNTSVTIIQNPAVSVLASITKVSCFGGSNGGIDLTVTGGIPGYLYAWTGPSGYTADTEDISGLVEGEYSAVITDNIGCVIIAGPYFVLQNPLLTINVPPAMVTDVTCYGGNSGAINISPAGGATPYIYNWNDDIHSQNRTGLIAGSYSVTIIDAANCIVSDSYIIIQPEPYEVTSVITDASCYQYVDGAVDLTVSGSVSPYTYQWSNGVAIEDNTGIPSGAYDVTITDAHSCIYTAMYFVSQPPAFYANTASLSEISCNGMNDGQITVNLINGIYPFEFLWSNGATDQTLGGLSFDTYTVTVTDAQGCIANSAIAYFPWDTQVVFTATSHYILLPNTLTVDIAGESIESGDYIGVFYWVYTYDSYGNKIDSTLNCGGYALWSGSVNAITAWGADAGVNGFANFEPIKFKIWRTSLGYDVNVNSFTYSMAFDPLEFYDGSMSVIETLTVNSSEIPGDPTEISLTEPAVLNVMIPYTYPTTCPGSFGYAMAFAFGGTTPYYYLWSDGSTNSDLNAFPGDYTVTVTDSHGCSGTASATITGPDQFVFDYTITNPSCPGASDGAIDLTVTGGTTPYMFIAPGTNMTGLSAGPQYFMVMDGIGCTGNDVVMLTDPEPIVPTAYVSDVTCNGTLTGSIDLEVTGGTSPYSYSWSQLTPPFDTFSTEDLTDLPAGTYFVYVTDSHFCGTSTLVNVFEPEALQLSTSVTNVNCNYDQTGAINLYITGGAAPYSHIWSNGDTSEDISGIGTGTYSVVVTDTNGCTAGTSASVSFSSQFYVTDLNITPVSCAEGNNGSVFIEVNYGHSNFTWRDFNNSIIGTAGDQISSTISNLVSGIYYVRIDNMYPTGCYILDTVEVTEPDPLTYDATVTNVSCYKKATGGIDITVYGGTPGYSYNWSTGSVGLGTDQDLTMKKAGNYKVIVTDINGCSFDETFEIWQPPTKLVPTVAITNVSCFGDSNGAIDLSVAGGGTPYTYLWAPTGDITEDLTGLSGGTFTVSVTDAYGCVIPKTAGVIEPEQLIVDIQATPVSYHGGNDGNATAFVSGGTTPLFGVYWSNGGTNDDIVNLYAGTYTVTVIDANQCPATNSVEITEPPIQPEIVNNSTPPNQPGINVTPVVDVNLEIKVYPNPNREARFTVDFGTIDPVNTQLRVFDQFGKLIFNNKVNDNKSSVYILNLNGTAAGIYYLQVITEQYGLLNKQLIITE